MTATSLLSAVLRGDATRWPASRSLTHAQEFLERAVAHRVVTLTAWRLRQAGTLDQWPDIIRTQFATTTRVEVLLETFRHGELKQLLAALGAAGVGTVLLKGAALAYSLYPETWLRPRSDTDLLVRGDDLDRAIQVLITLGYRRANGLSGKHVSHQQQWTKTDGHGVKHILDVHSKISNRPGFCEVLSYEELAARAVGVDALGGKVPGDVDALLLACLHRVAHHRNDRSLLWAYDIHSLFNRLAESGRERFAQVAREKRIAAICAAGLNEAVLAFETVVPTAIEDRLRVAGEPSAVLLGERPWRGDIRLSDLTRLEGVRAKVQFVKEVALPNADFMLRTYGYRRRAVVPVLHVHRVARGTWRLLCRFIRSTPAEALEADWGVRECSQEARRHICHGFASEVNRAG